MLVRRVSCCGATQVHPNAVHIRHAVTFKLPTHKIPCVSTYDDPHLTDPCLYLPSRPAICLPETSVHARLSNYQLVGTEDSSRRVAFATHNAFKFRELPRNLPSTTYPFSGYSSLATVDYTLTIELSSRTTNLTLNYFKHRPLAGARLETLSAPTNPAQDEGLLSPRADGGDGGGKNSAAVIGGATIGSVLFAVLLGVGVFLYRRRRRQRSRDTEPSVKHSHGEDVEDPTTNQATPLGYLSPKTPNADPSQQSTTSNTNPSHLPVIYFAPPNGGQAPPYP